MSPTSAWSVHGIVVWIARQFHFALLRDFASWREPNFRRSTLSQRREGAKKRKVGALLKRELLHNLKACRQFVLVGRACAHHHFKLAGLDDEAHLAIVKAQ